MSGVSAGRALKHVVRRRRSEGTLRADPQAPPLYWGRIGSYDAVSRGGVLFLLDPGPAHPSVRVRSGA